MQRMVKLPVPSVGDSIVVPIGKRLRDENHDKGTSG